MTVHGITFTAIDGGELALADWRGKALLVVNTASYAATRGNTRTWRRCGGATATAASWILASRPTISARQEPGGEAEIKSRSARRITASISR